MSIFLAQKVPPTLAIQRGAYGRLWPIARATAAGQGVRLLGSTCRRKLHHLPGTWKGGRPERPVRPVACIGMQNRNRPHARTIVHGRSFVFFAISVPPKSM